MNELAVSGLHGGIAEKEIIRGVNLRVRPGEIHIIMGPNGGGKSTLSYLLMGHPEYKITQGSVSLNGNDITHLSADKRARQGLFLGFQHPPEISGVDVTQVLQTATNKSGDEASTTSFMGQIDTLAEKLGLPEEMSGRSLNQGFSGGEKKRAEILQLAILKPKFAILDEPDSGLDVDGLRKIADALNDISPQMGLVIITHHQHILRYIKPDFVHILVRGKIVESGDKSLADRIENQGYQTYAG